jgi:hypothetical protein
VTIRYSTIAAASRPVVTSFSVVPRAPREVETGGAARAACLIAELI